MLGSFVKFFWARWVVLGRAHRCDARDETAPWKQARCSRCVISLCRMLSIMLSLHRFSVTVTSFSLCRSKWSLDMAQLPHTVRQVVRRRPAVGQKGLSCCFPAKAASRWQSRGFTSSRLPVLGKQAARCPSWASLMASWRGLLGQLIRTRDTFPLWAPNAGAFCHFVSIRVFSHSLRSFQLPLSPRIFSDSSWRGFCPLTNVCAPLPGTWYPRAPCVVLLLEHTPF